MCARDVIILSFHLLALLAGVGAGFKIIIIIVKKKSYEKTKPVRVFVFRRVRDIYYVNNVYTGERV